MARAVHALRRLEKDILAQPVIMNSKSASIAVFVVLFLAGMILSARKPLWTDEIHTQVNTVERLSYPDILLLEYFPEGNRCPLFYVIQKAAADFFHYRFPVSWDKRWNFSDLRSQVILRVPAVFFMSAALAVIFYFFSRYYGLRWGAWSLAAALATPIVWQYWAEARPYALWFFLTVTQLTVFLRLLSTTQADGRLWHALILVHVLLALTVIFSAGQIAVVALMLWRHKDRRLAYPLLSAIPPLVMTLFYFLHSRQMYYWADTAADNGRGAAVIMGLFADNLGSLAVCFPTEYMAVAVLISIVSGYDGFIRRQRTPGDPRNLQWVTLMLLSAAALLLMFCSSTAMKNILPGRYFIYLTPAAIFGVTLFSVSLTRRFRNSRYAFMNLVFFLAGLWVLRTLATFLTVYAQGLY